MRIAQDLRFMMEPPSDLPPEIAEERRRTFWSLYILDRLVSCGRGRPPAILDSSCQLQLPSDEDTWRERRWRQNPTLEQVTNRALVSLDQQGPLAHAVIMAYTLSRGAQYILQGFNSRNRYPPWDSSSDFAAIESDLFYLETALQMDRSLASMIEPYRGEDGQMDQATTGPIVFSRALFHLSYCLLYHPFLLRKRIESFQITAPASFLSRTFDSGWDHAKHLTELLREAREAGCMTQASFYSYCAVICGTIFALNIHGEKEHTRNSSFPLLQEITAYLERMGQYWKNASSMVRVNTQPEGGD